MKYIAVATPKDLTNAYVELTNYVSTHDVKLTDLADSDDGHYVDTRANVLKHLDADIPKDDMNWGIAHYGEAIKNAYDIDGPLVYVGYGFEDVHPVTYSQLKTATKKAHAYVKFNDDPQVRAILKLVNTKYGQAKTVSDLYNCSTSVTKDRGTLNKAMDLLEKLMKKHGTSTEDLAEKTGDWTADDPDYILASVDWLLCYYGNDPENADIIREHAEKHHDKYVSVDDEVYINSIDGLTITNYLEKWRDYIVEHTE